MRRAFLERIKNRCGANFVALGHHADDQAETFFIRLVRGTTLEGLGCMRWHHQGIIRPLLYMRKAEIIAALEKSKSRMTMYLTDPSNASDKHLRNRIRHKVLPALEEADPRAPSKLTDTIAHLQDDFRLMQKLVDEKIAQLEVTPFEAGQSGGQYDLTAFKKLGQTLQQRILVRLFSREKAAFSPSTSWLNEGLRFLNSPRGGSHKLAPGIVLVKKGRLWGASFTNSYETSP